MIDGVASPDQDYLHSSWCCCRSFPSLSSLIQTSRYILESVLVDILVLVRARENDRCFLCVKGLSVGLRRGVNDELTTHEITGTTTSCPTCPCQKEVVARCENMRAHHQAATLPMCPRQRKNYIFPAEILSSRCSEVGLGKWMLESKTFL